MAARGLGRGSGGGARVELGEGPVAGRGLAWVGGLRLAGVWVGVGCGLRGTARGSACVGLAAVGAVRVGLRGLAAVPAEAHHAGGSRSIAVGDLGLAFGHNGPVIEMSAVVAAHHLVSFPDWPTGPYSDGDVVLSGRMSREDVGTALASIAEYNNGGKHEVDGPSTLGVLLGKKVVASGGLRVRDVSTGVEIEPGCCVGLETWRDWQYLVDGRTPWLGHDPWPEVRFEGEIVRVWPDSRDTGGPACEIRLAELPVHLAVVQQDLQGFLELVRKWAPYGTGERLADVFDAHFHVSAPL